MKKSDKLQAEESQKRSFYNIDLVSGDSKYIRPIDNKFVITPIVMFNDNVAIAPLPKEGKTDGGIVLPDAVQDDIGIVIGIGPLALMTADGKPTNLMIGQLVKYLPRQVCDLTGYYPEYSNAWVQVVKFSNIIAALPMSGISIVVQWDKPEYSGT